MRRGFDDLDVENWTAQRGHAPWIADLDTAYFVSLFSVSADFAIEHMTPIGYCERDHVRSRQ